MTERNAMLCRSLLAAIGSCAIALSTAGTQIFDYSKYPDLKGQWNRFIVPGLPGLPSFDQTRPWGFGQGAPLTPEYQAILKESIADQENGGHGNSSDHARCVAAGMPFMMVALRPLGFIVAADTTYN